MFMALISTPIIYLLLFFLGSVLIVRRLSFRFLKLSPEKEFNDMWRGNKERMDIIIFFIIVLVSLYFIWSYQNLSYINYFHWIQIISEFEYMNGFAFDIFLKNLSFSLLWIVPLAILYKLDWKKIKTYERNFFIILFFSSLTLSFIGSRKGAGTAELFSLIPPALFLFCKSYKRGTYYISKKIFGFKFSL